MALVAVYDACVLHPAALRDTLIRLALTGLVRARWSDAILDEWERSILRIRPDLDRAPLRRTRELMNLAVPDAVISGFEVLVAGLDLPDPDDRHVLAAAIHGGAQAIVTFNLKDFPPEKLSSHGIEAVHPDDLVLDLLDVEPGLVCQAIERQASALKSPPMSVSEVLATIEQQGLARSAARLRGLFVIA